MTPEEFGNLLPILIALFAVLIFLLYVASMIWAYMDAEGRGKSGCMWMLIIFFTWPFGFIAYILLRDREVRL